MHKYSNCEILYHSYKAIKIFTLICLSLDTVNTVSDYVLKFVRNEKKNKCTLMTFQSNNLLLLMLPANKLFVRLCTVSLEKFNDSDIVKS